MVMEFQLFPAPLFIKTSFSLIFNAVAHSVRVKEIHEIIHSVLPESVLLVLFISFIFHYSLPAWFSTFLFLFSVSLLYSLLLSCLSFHTAFLLSFFLLVVFLSPTHFSLLLFFPLSLLELPSYAVSSLSCSPFPFASSPPSPPSLSSL